MTLPQAAKRRPCIPPWIVHVKILRLLFLPGRGMIISTI